MCKALEEMCAEARKKGLEKGMMQYKIEQLCKKLCCGKSVEQIAGEMGEKEQVVQEFCVAAVLFAPDYDSMEVYKAWKVRSCENQV